MIGMNYAVTLLQDLSGDWERRARPTSVGLKRAGKGYHLSRKMSNIGA
jgi:hypothetical protein